MAKPNAQVRMKALVAARLLMGDFGTWESFEQERETAAKVINRRIARSVSAQIGRRYGNLSAETKKFISANFSRCDYDDLARLCEDIPVGLGLYLRLDEFEQTYFPLAEQIRFRFPFYAHVSISTYGLQFEFPEHHFLSDLKSAFKELEELRFRMADFREIQPASIEGRGQTRDIVSREKFVSRGIINAGFSLVESFLSGVFFTALHTGSIGSLKCDDDFLEYAKKRENAALKGRLDRVVKFVSQETATGEDNPFQSFIEFGKLYRDAIHHTTPFERPHLKAGKRFEALYRIDGDIALACALYSLDTVLAISVWASGDVNATAIATECQKLKDEASRILGSK